MARGKNGQQDHPLTRNLKTMQENMTRHSEALEAKGPAWLSEGKPGDLGSILTRLEKLASKS